MLYHFKVESPWPTKDAELLRLLDLKYSWWQIAAALDVSESACRRRVQFLRPGARGQASRGGVKGARL